MRKPILLSALLTLALCPSLASFAGETSSGGGSQQGQQGSSEASTSATVSNNRMVEELPPMARPDPPQANNVTVAKTPQNQQPAHPVVQVVNTNTAGHPGGTNATPQGQVNSYVWKK